MLTTNRFYKQNRETHKMRIAVIDLGTNTFNLLIAEGNNKNDFTILYNQKIAVKLGEKRIGDGEIIPAAYQRGIAAIINHSKTIQEYNVDKIKAFGTSALRTSKNGKNFLNDIVKATNIHVEIISGDREAELICEGVSQTYCLNEKHVVILDIGGGSNEFIIANKNGIAWKKSYPLGIARLIAKFNPADPLSKNQIEAIEHYFEDELSDLFKQLKDYNITTLVGASGSFETFTAMIADTDWVSETTKTAHSTFVSLEDFNTLYQRLIFSTTEERKQMRGLEPMRVEMIVLAVLFVKFVTTQAGITEMYQSNFALKEGAVAELLTC